ncbi:hypothetical protein AJ79_02615 [Helicocarpus griseus UAMH5409]|uniref:Uncharacterized protein n=1 Tax=Helicocarpus griseus UAMH5409 TaxID=1447875 RepID=A0A2B7Y1S0_9EURO|nr:hypothetical protein AJ79_02615 [Helicocarpus griseus UAMH5409]
MDLISLVVLSLSMALFGAFQKTFANIRLDNDSTGRLQGHGYTFGKFSEILNAYFPPKQPTLTILEHALPTDPPVRSSSITVAASVCSKPNVTLASATARAGPASKPTAAQSLIALQKIVTDDSDFSQDEGPGLFSNLFETLISVLLVDSEFFVRIFVFTLFASGMMLLLSSSCFFLLYAYTRCSRVWLEFSSKVDGAYGAIDRAIAEFELQRSLLQERLEQKRSLLQERLDSSDAKMIEGLERIEKEMEVVNMDFNRTSKQVYEECARLKKAVLKMNEEHTPWPTRDDLLHKYITDFKESLTTSKAELDEEIERIQKLVPNFTAEFHRTVKRLNENTLGSLPKVYLEERAVLQANIRKIRETMNELPDLPTLQEEAAAARIEMEEIRSALEDIVRDSRRGLRDLPFIYKDINELKRKLTDLEEELELARLALKTASKGVEEFPTIARNLPKGSVEDFPADLVNDLLGESGSSDEEDEKDKTPKPPKKSAKRGNSLIIQASSSPKSITSGSVPKSLLIEQIPDSPSEISGKGGQNVDGPASEPVSSPSYKMDELWSSVLETVSSGEDSDRDLKKPGLEKGEMPQLAASVPLVKRRTRPNKKRRERQRAAVKQRVLSVLEGMADSAPC